MSKINNTTSYLTKEAEKTMQREYELSKDDYRGAFENYLRNRGAGADKLMVGKKSNSMFELPSDTSRDYQNALLEESTFRKIATCVSAPRTNSTIWTSDGAEKAEWVSEGEPLDIGDISENFSSYRIAAHKLAVLTRVNNDFVSDTAFNIKKHLVKRFAKLFNRAEEDAFINGSGTNEPVGILHESAGAEVGVTTSELTFDDILNLYTSVKAEYRKKGAWLMSDETALTLRTLKDKDGNYIWNQNNDTILGKPVYTSEFMPGIASGNKVIAFGDFSYYWIVNRSNIAVRTLAEKFALKSQTGYLANEFLDAKLIRPEAIKVIQMA